MEMGEPIWLTVTAMFAQIVDLLANRANPTQVNQAFAIWVHANSNGRGTARRIAEAFNVADLHKHGERDPHAWVTMGKGVIIEN
jgi:hypothetical protein